MRTETGQPININPRTEEIENQMKEKNEAQTYRTLGR